MIPRPLHQNKSEFPEKVSKFTFFSSKNEYLIATTNCFVRSFFFFFFYHGFLHRGWRFSGQQGKRRDHLLFHSTTPTHSRTLRHVFATLYVRWVSRIFNRNACVYQTATRWDLPPYRITIWVIDWWCNVCLLDELILGFCYSDLTLEAGGFELASNITLVLQANRLTKRASHPN